MWSGLKTARHQAAYIPRERSESAIAAQQALAPDARTAAASRKRPEALPPRAATAFQEEIGPADYSQTVADMKNWLQLHVSEWDLEFREDESDNGPNYAN